MARKTKAKREVIGYRLDVYNTQYDRDASQPKWLTPNFSFNFKNEALAYRAKHYPGAKKFRVYAVRLRADLGVQSGFYFNSLLQEKQQKKAA